MGRVFLAILIALASSPLMAQGRGLWLERSFVNPYGLEGLEFSFDAPMDFIQSDTQKPGALAEYNYVDYKGGKVAYIRYLSISIRNFSRILNFNEYFKDDYGNWIDSSINQWWVGFVNELKNATEFSSFYVHNNPVCDIKIIQNQDIRQKFYTEIDLRAVLANNSVIILQCGDMMDDKDVNQHSDTINNVCARFFESLTIF